MSAPAPLAAAEPIGNAAAACAASQAPPADTAAVHYELHVNHPPITAEVQAAIDTFRAVRKRTRAGTTRARTGPPPLQQPMADGGSDVGSVAIARC